MASSMNPNHVGTGAAGIAGVGGLAAVGRFLESSEPVLASVSHIAAILVAVVTLYFMVRNRGK